MDAAGRIYTRTMPGMHRVSGRHTALAAGEVLVTVALATVLVAALDRVATSTGLAFVYILAVLTVAIRHGGAAALAAAVLGVLAFNYFFIAPVHRLTIADSENVAALVVFFVVAIVVGRLAAAARERAAEAEERARQAARRESEAEMLAGVSALLLSGSSLETRLDAIAARVAPALGAPVRLERSAAPAPREAERAVAVPVAHGRLWAYLPQTATPDAAAQTRLFDALAAIFDIADERERLVARAAEAESAQRADVAKTAVLHAISHDLRSPLTAITTAASGLDDDRVTGEDRTELVAVLRHESDRLAHLVDDLLDLSRVQAGAVNPRVDWVDVHEVVGRAASQVHAAPVAIELPADLPLVRADESQMERVFLNLLDNAARFSPPGRPVRVTGGSGGGNVIVRVTDEGPGVPLGQSDAVFEPFYRGRRSTTATVGRDGGGPGAGLGLAICRGFVEANGGRLRLQRPVDGHGATFAVSLPARSPDAPA
jgi:two-component system, OmpR family, sensor histidine kinase KdpD